MIALLTEASNALSRNDTAALEALCAQLTAGPPDVNAPPAALTARERAAFHGAMLAFQRQVLAARTNLVLRQRLFAAHGTEPGSWDR